MNEVVLIFPHQLFERHPACTKGKRIFLVEEFLFFRQYKFHKQKLVFHRASMKAYQHYLTERGLEVKYVEANDPLADVRSLVPYLKQQGINSIHYVDTVDYYLERRLAAQTTKFGMRLIRYESPHYMLTSEQLQGYFTSKRKFFQTDFYIEQRKRFNILLSAEGQPWGGKWTFDHDNRLKYPKGKRPPAVNFPSPNMYWVEAQEYVERNFKDNYGRSDSAFTFPVTFTESHTWLNEFLTTRFQSFGDYEDAMVTTESVLNHSVLTPMLNSGLLTPTEVIQQTLAFATKNNIPVNSTEGFIRQIIGWREFIRGLYVYKGTQQRTTNFWKFSRKIPESFWNGTTGIEPVDIVIQRVLTTGYCHHIERLMVLGNFMLLCEFDPDEVYTWFMVMFIDAYDWVMVPNAYGMSQFADGGMMATKPYISGSNYLMKMSDFKKGNWQKTWDGLFWRFLHVHRDFFLKNPRLSMLVRMFDKMDEQKQMEHLKNAADFLQQLDMKDSAPVS